MRFFREFFTTIWKNILLILISYGAVLAALYFYDNEDVIQILLILPALSAMLVLIGSRPDASLSWKYSLTVISRTVLLFFSIILLFVLAGAIGFYTNSYWVGLFLIPIVFSVSSNSIYITTAMKDDDIRFLPLKDLNVLENFMLAVLASFFIFILKTFIGFKSVMAAAIVLTTLLYFIMGKVSYEEGLREIFKNGPPLPKFVRKKTSLIEKFIMLVDHHARKGVSA